jgi:hypothetical protein
MMKVIYSWKSSTEKGFFMGVKIERPDGYFAKYCIEITKTLHDSLSHKKGDEIEVPADCLR